MTADPCFVSNRPSKAPGTPSPRVVGPCVPLAPFGAFDTTDEAHLLAGDRGAATVDISVSRVPLRLLVPEPLRNNKLEIPIPRTDKKRGALVLIIIPDFF